MLLHLFNDEKVVNRTIENFEKVFPQQNIYICFAKKLKYVNKNVINLYLYNGSEDFDSNILNNIDKIIIHYLTYEKVIFIQKYVTKKIPCYWMIWGGDLYNDILAYRGYNIYYEPYYLDDCLYKRILRQFLLKFKILPFKVKKVLNFIKDGVTHFVTGADFEIAKQYIGKYIKGNQVIGFRYYPIDSILGNLINSKAKGKIILIGNSASVSNNHLYAFEYISNLNLEGKEILTPLSYGGTSRYINHIIKYGEEKWGKSFNALLNFLPLDEYNKYLLASEICIFPSWRQEAFGNIVVSLYLGSKVFLSQKSSLYSYFKKIGITLFILENITQNDVDTPLTEAVIENNRKILLKLLSEETILHSIKHIWS